MVQNIRYNIEAHILKAKCSTLYIKIPGAVVTDLILGHDFLEKYGVILDYTCQIIFMDNDNHIRILRIAWHNGNALEKDVTPLE